MFIRPFNRRLAQLSGRIPLRTILIVPFVAQLLGAVGLVGYISFRNGQKAVNDIASQLRNEVTIRTDEYLDNYLKLPHKVNKINADAVRLGILNAYDFSLMERYFWQQLQEFETVSYIQFGTEDGKFIGDERLDENTFTVEVKDIYTGVDKLVYRLDSEGYRTDEQVGVSEDYDPRQRPWYKAAVAAGEPTWSTIYQFSSDTAVRLGITAVEPYFDAAGERLGVWGTDIVLSHLSDFLRTLEIGESGQVFITERDGLLVASSVLDQPFTVKDGEAERIQAAEATDPLIRSTTQALLDEFGSLAQIQATQQFDFDLDGERQFVQVLPFQDGRGIDWLIVVAVPEADFMGQINENARTTLLLCLAALAVATGIGILTARWVVRPILQFNNAAKDIAQGEWDKTVSLNRRDELGQLANSFNQMAHQLQNSFETLEHRVEERTAELAEAKQRAEVANEAKSTFLANMSHELRSPLNAILGFSQLLTRSQTLDPDHQENVNIITRSGEHLLTLINQVLDLSKIEAGRVTLNATNFDLHRLLNDLEDMFQLKADEKQLNLVFEKATQLPRYVRTDQVKLRQVLINLLNNALKFTPAGNITLKAWVDQAEALEVPNGAGVQALNPTDANLPKYPPLESGILHFAVVDTGIGIALEEQNQLFETFAQAEAGRQSQEGTGLGLPISRQFIRLMGGDIQVNSVLGQGTTLEFNIQAEVVSAADIESHESERQVIALAPGQPRYRILIVDDKPINRQLLIKLLNPLGFELQEAENGQVAVERWEQWKPHLIWMDMRMPIMDGYAATQQIKSTIKGQAVAIIALTASVLEEERAVILSTGCDDFVRKPFKHSEIFVMLERHLGIEFIYEEFAAQTPDPNRSRTLTTQDIQSLPTPLVNQLGQGLKQGDLETIASTIAQIHNRNPDLANTIKFYTDQFDFDRILDVIPTS
ncbi:MAG: response regulator [Microcoleaceae cyanobacterium]